MLVTAVLIVLPADSAVSETLSVALLAAERALLPVDFARELAARPADLPLLRAERPDELDFELPLLLERELPLLLEPELPLAPELPLPLPPERELALPLPPERELPPDAERERLEPLLEAADGPLPLPFVLPEDLRLAVRPRVAARVLSPDPEDPFEDVPEDDFAREDARPEEPREVVAAISLNLRSERAAGPILVGLGQALIHSYPGLRGLRPN